MAYFVFRFLFLSRFLRIPDLQYMASNLNFLIFEKKKLKEEDTSDVALAMRLVY